MRRQSRCSSVSVPTSVPGAVSCHIVPLPLAVSSVRSCSPSPILCSHPSLLSTILFSLPATPRLCPSPLLASERLPAALLMDDLRSCVRAICRHPPKWRLLWPACPPHSQATLQPHCSTPPCIFGRLPSLLLGRRQASRPLVPFCLAPPRRPGCLLGGGVPALWCIGADTALQ